MVCLGLQLNQYHQSMDEQPFHHHYGIVNLHILVLKQISPCHHRICNSNNNRHHHHGILPPFHMDFQRHRMSTHSINKSILFSFLFARSRRPVPSLSNPMGNGNPANNLILGNGNLPISQTKKSTQNNFFSFLPSSSSTTTNQNKYNNLQSMSNPLQRPPAMTNFIPTQNGQSPPPPPHMNNGNDIESNFPPMNVSTKLVKQNSKFLFFCSRMMPMI